MADRFDEILAEMRSDRAERERERAERERERAERERERVELVAEREREHAERERVRAEREREHAERERVQAERELERADWSAKMDRRLDQTDELLRFVGELNRRSELVFQNVVRELREMRAETRASTVKIQESTEMSKAHTRAIFALIDRLEGGNGGIAPAT